MNTKYVAELPVRNRFAASVRIRTESKIDSIGFVVRKLFQLPDGKDRVPGRGVWGAVLVG